MKKKHHIIYLILITSALAIICFITIIYIRQLNKTISDNITRSISEIAEHDKASIRTYIKTCWKDLYEIQERFTDYHCNTIQDIEARLDLECGFSNFTHIYLLAEDGTIYTDQYIKYVPGSQDKNLDLRKYFSNGKDRIITRFNNKLQDNDTEKENILYGVRLHNYKIEGIKILALIGASEISSIQDNMVIDSFIKDGKSRGHSALIDMDGNYIVDINKEVYQNNKNNLFKHLSEARNSELTIKETAEKLKNMETFSFYHSHKGEKDKELFYFIPFGDETGLYFIMSVNEVVFMEQTKTFVTMSIAMLAGCIFTVISMLLAVMKYQNKIIRTEEKAKSQKNFLSNMSHEIRTPLNGLIGMNHLIMIHIDDDSQKPQIKEWLKKSHSTADYLLSLVNDILDMSKLQAGKVDIINEPLLVESLIDDVVAMQADNIKIRGIEFIIDKNIIEPCIEGDATRIKQILMNIVGNAAKFTPKGKYIKLTASQEKTDSTHVITTYKCEDTGIGISQEYIGKIFDSFSQERNRNTNGIKGTGLGMAISKLLANAMDGDITVESTLNVGSTFTVTIPSVIVKDIPEELIEYDTTDTVHSPERKDGKPIKILVAEDVELNAEVLLEILATEGFETVHAHNGQEAISIFQESEDGEFDIILMDMQMPVMDGCTASSKIRQLDKADAQSVIIYACTANTFKEDRELALANGMNDFLTKPIDVDILLKKISKIIK